MRLVEVGDIELEIHDLGQGDPVVLVQTALTADELAPLAALVATRGPYRAIAYHRRGYLGSSRFRGRDRWSGTPPTAETSSPPCAWTVHVVGYSTAAPWPCSSPSTPRTTSTP